MNRRAGVPAGGAAAAARAAPDRSLRCRPNMVSAWLTSGGRNAVARRDEFTDRRWGFICRGGAGAQRMGRFEQLAEQRPRQWRRESIALGEKNAAFAKEFHLVKVFDALGEYLHPHAAR